MDPKRTDVTVQADFVATTKPSKLHHCRTHAYISMRSRQVHFEAYLSNCVRHCVALARSVFG
eukprot:2411511-Pleurochrysis_carterae.AAC.1